MAEELSVWDSMTGAVFGSEHEITPASVIVHLIHGTFAPDAEWTQEHAALATELNALFGSNIWVMPASWSGDNAFDARNMASAKLRDAIQFLQRYFPNSKQLLIAHSHGGNVALYALQDLAPGHNVTGCACLATPFIHARLRDNDLYTADHLAKSVSAILAIIPLLFRAFWHISYLKELAMMACLLIGARLIGMFLNVLLKEFEPEAKHLVENMQAVSPKGVHLLLLRKTGDEAAMALSTGQFISFLTSNVYTRLVQARSSAIGFQIRQAKTPKFLWYLWISVPSVALLWVMGQAVWGWPAFWSPVVSGIAGSVLLISVLASKTTMLDNFALAGAFMAVIVSNVVTSLAFGVWHGHSTTVGPLRRTLKATIMSFLVDINTEASPAGEHTFVQFERDPNLDHQGAMLHSLYNDPRVRKVVAEWVKHWIPDEHAA
jgi:hypothetical protein